MNGCKIAGRNFDTSLILRLCCVIVWDIAIVDVMAKLARRVPSGDEGLAVAASCWAVG